MKNSTQPDLDNQFQIERIVETLTEHPSTLPNLLDVINKPAVGNALGSAYNFGLGNFITLAWSGYSLKFKPEEDRVTALIRDGLLDQLARVAENEPEQFEEIIEKASELKAVGPYKDLVMDLNDGDFFAAALSNNEAISAIYEKLIKYQEASTKLNKARQEFLDQDKAYQAQKNKYETFLKTKSAKNDAARKAMESNLNDVLLDANDRFNKARPGLIEDATQRYVWLVDSIVAIRADEKVRKSLAKLFTPDLMNHIHELEALKELKNSKRIFANMAAENPEKFQDAVGTILAQDQKDLEKVTKALFDYLYFPANPNNDPVIAKEASKKWKDMLYSLVELGVINPEVQGKLKELATSQLVEDIFQLDALTKKPAIKAIEERLDQVNKEIVRSALNPGFKTEEQIEELRRKYEELKKEKSGMEEGSKSNLLYKDLVKDLAAGNPEAFKALAGAILASEGVLDVSDKILTYLSSTAEDVAKNPKIWQDFMDSLYKLIAEKNVAESIAPVLNDKLVDNLMQLPALQSYKAISMPLKRIVHAFSENKESVSALLEMVQSSMDPAKTTNIVEDGMKKAAPELKQIIDQVQQAGEIAPEKAEIAKKGLELMAKADEEIKPGPGVKTIDYAKFAPVLRGLAIDKEFQENISQMLREGQMEEFLKSALGGNEEIKKWGLKEKDVALLVQKISSKEGLNALADYLEGKKGLLNIIKKTQTRLLIVECLVTRAANYLTQDLPNMVSKPFRSSISPAVQAQSAQQRGG